MATQTIILRPTGTATGSNASYTPFPTNTAKEDVYLLISEEFADDDATYLVAKGTSLSGGILFTTTNLNITPINIRIVTRMRTTIANSTALITYSIVDGTENLEIINLSEEYVTYVQSIPSEHTSGFWNAMLTNEISHITISAGSTSTDTKASKDVRITQLYLEVDYDDGTGSEEITETIYLKENGSWTSIPCTIYQKQNGAWVQTDSSIFENGENFILQEVI